MKVSLSEEAAHLTPDHIESYINESVHLQVLLGTGLALLCFSLLLGCTLCWPRSKRHNLITNSDNGYKKQTPECRMVDISAPVPCKTIIPIKLQYEEIGGEVLEGASPSLNNLPGSFSSEKSISNSKVSLPRIILPPNVHLSSKPKRIIERRRTLSGSSVTYDEHCRLMSLTSLSLVRQSHTMAGDLSNIKSKRRPLLHFTLSYSQSKATLTVTVLGVSNLSKRFYNSCDSYVKVYLLPKFIEPQRTALRRRSLNPEFREQFHFSSYSLEELQGFTLRFAVYTREFQGLRDSFIGEVLFPCAQGKWNAEESSGYSRELSATKTKLKKCLSSLDITSSSLSEPKSLGQLFLLLQYQALANRIKVMVRKAENLSRLTRMPGAPDHYVVIHLYQDGRLKETKETKSVAGYNPVWNAPFLFDMPAGNIQEQQISIKFIVIQGRIYKRSCALGRVLIGPSAPGSGFVHWKEMCSRGHIESARWHSLQPNE
ncbi:synaptotagmin-5 [Microcaecilia unicolor]|uniref:Synaptotagmin-5-like n=1 Tax=Microcaecilia unicolor TaxID=1415580 RepID=A0A6P7X6L2_9AMPH|nr:synaptotagmin-5-like [Microcaecilia unicolor]